MKVSYSLTLVKIAHKMLYQWGLPKSVTGGKQGGGCEGRPSHTADAVYIQVDHQHVGRTVAANALQVELHTCPKKESLQKTSSPLSAVGARRGVPGDSQVASTSASYSPFRAQTLHLPQGSTSHCSSHLLIQLSVSPSPTIREYPACMTGAYHSMAQVHRLH